MSSRFDLFGVISLKDKLSGKMETASKKFERNSKRFSKGMRGIGKAGKFLAGGPIFGALSKLKLPILAAGAAAGVLAVKTVQAGAAYEQAITNVGAVALKTREEISELDAKAQEIGSTSKFTATEAAEAMTLLSKTGYDTEQVLGGIGGVMAAAAAEGVGVAEVTEHITGIMKGMNLEASRTGEVADVLALASSKTRSSISTLGISMANVAATARDLGMSLPETVAAVAGLQDVGLDASVAGSALNTMLTKMSKPSGAVLAQMKKWGVTFKDAQGNMLKFPKVLENISKAAAASGGNMDRVAFLADLVGLRGQKAASNLAKLFDSGQYNKLYTALQDAKGKAQEMADLKMDTLTGSFTLLKSAIEGVQIKVLETNGGLKGLVDKTTEWTNANKGDIALGMKGFLLYARELADVFKGSFMKSMPQIKKLWDDLTSDEESVAWRESLFEAARALGTILGVVLRIGMTLLKIQIPIWRLTISIIKGIIDVFAAIWTYGEKVFGEGGLGMLITNIGEAMRWVGEIILGRFLAPLKLIGVDTKALVKIVMDGFKKAGDFVLEIWGQVASAVLGYIGGMIDEIVWLLEKMGILDKKAGGKGIGDGKDGAPGTPAEVADYGPQVSPAASAGADAFMQHLTTVNTQRAEVLIKDATGRASIQSPTRGPVSSSVKFQPSGSFP